MPGVLRWKLVVAIVVVAIAACSDNPTITTPAAAPTTVPAPTTTAQAPTTTVAPTTTTTSTTTPVSTELVGDPAALEALVEQLNADFIGYEGEIPIPDLTNPDPRIALEEIQRFDFWATVAKTSSAWLSIHLFEGGPDFESSLSSTNNAVANNWGFVVAGDYRFEEAQTASLEHPSIPDAVRATAPPGAVVVTFKDALPAYQVIDLDDSSIIVDAPASVLDEEIAVLVPTATGWKLFYSGDL